MCDTRESGGALAGPGLLFRRFGATDGSRSRVECAKRMKRAPHCVHISAVRDETLKKQHRE